MKDSIGFKVISEQSAVKKEEKQGDEEKKLVHLPESVAIRGWNDDNITEKVQ